MGNNYYSQPNFPMPIYAIPYPYNPNPQNFQQFMPPNSSHFSYSQQNFYNKNQSSSSQ